MFRVVMEHHEDRKPTKEVDACMKTEKLYELLGRYLLKYGPPMIIEDSMGITEFEFYKQLDKGFISATVSFAKITDDKKPRQQMMGTSRSQSGYDRYRNNNHTPYTPPPPPKPREPDDPRIEALVKIGMLEETTWHR